MDQRGSRGAARQRIEQIVLELVEYREHISFSQLWRILMDAVPARLSGALLLSLGAVVGSALTLGWHSHKIFGSERAPGIEQLSPEETVSQYYALLSSGQHGKAWKLVAKGQYEGWISFWSKVEDVSVLEMVTLNETTNQATVRAKLSYLKKDDSKVTELNRLYLVRDAADKPWRISRSELLSAR